MNGFNLLNLLENGGVPAMVVILFLSGCGMIILGVLERTNSSKQLPSDPKDHAEGISTSSASNASNTSGRVFDTIKESKRARPWLIILGVLSIVSAFVGFAFWIFHFNSALGIQKTLSQDHCIQIRADMITQGIRIRAAPTVNSTELARLHYIAVLELIDLNLVFDETNTTSPRWYKVHWNNSIGYIREDLIVGPYACASECPANISTGPAQQSANANIPPVLSAVIFLTNTPNAPEPTTDSVPIVNPPPNLATDIPVTVQPTFTLPPPVVETSVAITIQPTDIVATVGVTIPPTWTATVMLPPTSLPTMTEVPLEPTLTPFVPPTTEPTIVVMPTLTPIESTPLPTEVLPTESPTFVPTWTLDPTLTITPVPVPSSTPVPYQPPTLACDVGTLVTVADNPQALLVIENAPSGYEVPFNIPDGTIAHELVVWSMVGHPELGCPTSGHELCSVQQAHEEIHISIPGWASGILVPDHGEHQWQRFTFAVALPAGTYGMYFGHPGGIDGYESVEFKAGVCISPSP